MEERGSLASDAVIAAVNAGRWGHTAQQHLGSGDAEEEGRNEALLLSRRLCFKVS